MNITTPADFYHAGLLSPRDASRDPREPSFREDLVDIDMRACEFVRPAAVLWCAIYPMLAARRARQCRLLVPENVGVCVYLKSLGLFGMLQEVGVEVDDRGIRDQVNPQSILPLTRFFSADDVENLAETALDTLSQAGLGSANIHPIVSEAFAELALNAVQHAESPIGGLGLIQFYQFERGKRFICAVADGGIGIRRALERNPALRDSVPYDWDAIKLALRERVTGTGERTRGIGLYGIAQDMRQTGRQLIIHSGQGTVSVSSGDAEDQSQRTTLFPGTLAYVSIAT
ncbi:MAG: hypothetical protein WEC75_08665 [Dehalococcoidia bacterium]